MSFLLKYSFTFSIASSILKDHQNTTLGTTLLLSDLTEIKKLEEQVNLKERLSALGEMAAGIAHEFRNSLAAIMGYTRLVKKQIPPDSRVQNLLASIMEESSSQEKIVRQFLDFTRPANLNLEKINFLFVFRFHIKSVKGSSFPEEFLVNDKTAILLSSVSPES